MNLVDYLRISLIDRCNFRCQYCMPAEAALDYVLPPELLTDAEILTLVREVFAPLGFRKFRLTGGEPLLRPGVVDLVRELATLPTTEDLALTTNAFLLADLAQPLYDAGLRRINISLDSPRCRHLRPNHRQSRSQPLGTNLGGHPGGAPRWL